MARIILKPGADPLQVAEDLRKVGITMKQRLPDGSYVAFISSRKWLCMQYPDLIPLYEEDRDFWKSVRARARNGEDVPQEEIYAHGLWFNEQFDKIMSKYENRTKSEHSGNS